MEKIQSTFHAINNEITKVVLGQEKILEHIFIAILVGGHLLLEGPPGVAKTLIAKSLAKTFQATYKRVQFTPDLMPLDITGTSIFNFQTQTFHFQPGPIFTDLLLADEINRTPPKTQAALLEAMEERQVSIDGVVKPLSPLFTTIATQNPLEYEGTYPLPEAQLDRFLFKLIITYPQGEDELAIYQRYQDQMVNEASLNKIIPQVSPETVLDLRQALAAIKASDDLIRYVLQIIQATREHPLLLLGASPRAGISLLLAAKARAALNGRDYLIPDDIQEMAYPLLRHRLFLKPEAQVNGKDPDFIVNNILINIKVPR